MAPTVSDHKRNLAAQVAVLCRSTHGSYKEQLLKIIAGVKVAVLCRSTHGSYADG
jgi:hypothetical protein